MSIWIYHDLITIVVFIFYDVKLEILGIIHIVASIVFFIIISYVRSRLAFWKVITFGFLDVIIRCVLFETS